MKKVAFIGTGNMGSALIKAACKSLGGEDVAITDHALDKAQALAQATGCTAYPDNRTCVQAAEYIFLCVKPHLIRVVLEEIAPVLVNRVVVSIAAGVVTADIHAWAGEGVPVLRIMPNTPCAIGKGMTALVAGPNATEAHLAAVEAILAQSGRVERIQESLIDAFGAVAGCGPAFVYPYIEALADGGVTAGLSRPQALTCAAQMMLGAAAMVLETGEHPGKLKDDVCSPGGSTIVGVAELERHGLRAAAIDAVLAACKKSAELGK